MVGGEVCYYGSENGKVIGKRQGGVKGRPTNLNGKQNT